MTHAIDPASFRDPSGFVFSRDGQLLRQVNESYREDYDLLMKSGLYEALTSRGLLVSHDEVDGDAAAAPGAYKVIEPTRVAFISYPYEWCFSQLKDAALATLAIQRIALKHDLSLKDASAYNIQFQDGKPVFIDTLSFEAYEEGKPWVAYRQFCQHFLAPLVLAARADVRLPQLLRVHVDGIPLDLASRLLPSTSWLSPGILAHIHLHARSQTRHANAAASSSSARTPRVSRLGLSAVIDSLENAVKKASWNAGRTEWGDYYNDTNYDDAAMQAKEAAVTEFLGKLEPPPKKVVDLGANIGRFSRIAGELGCDVISADIDPLAVEKNYREVKTSNENRLVPLIVDLTNPPASSGWANEERPSFLERASCDCTMALALIHHLAISNNVPLSKIAQLFHAMSEHLIIEFVPKTDSQVQRLLTSREDIFPHYNQQHFEDEFNQLFEIRATNPIPGTERTLYWMTAKKT